ncbi:molybdopterin molybdotransferase MoeA [Sphingobium sp.]|uniref:molybdopterin molybdotransferase MoeA n=1 Tax=Sphingobium sp. TaxID=1912891 RepID=UPI003BB4ADA0
MSLLPVAEAQSRLFTLAKALPVEDCPLVGCTERWLARDVVALRDQPWAALSAMDGYAVRASEWPGPWRVTTTSSAGGTPPDALPRDEACRIFTGAPLPEGADAILIQENAAVEDDILRAVDGALTSGQHVRPAASDFGQASLLLRAGSKIGPAQIALAALGGHGMLPVRRRVRVAIISTGNELVPPGAPTPPGSLPSSNAPMLAAMLAALPCDVIDLGIIGDNLDLLTVAFDEAADADIIVSTGGASVGDHDLVRPAFTKAGGTLDFWKIAMRPGKPLMAGRIHGALFIGLPGNPVSAFVTASLFLIPVIRHMSGASDPLPQMRNAVLASDLPDTGNRDDYLRARRDGAGIVTVTSQDSAAAASLAMADCLIFRPAGAKAAQIGENVSIISIG